MNRLLLALAALICFAVLSGSAHAQTCVNGQCSIVQRGAGYTCVAVPQYQMHAPLATTCTTGTCAPQAAYVQSYAAYRGGACGNGNRAARRGGRRGLFGGLFHYGG